MPLRVRMATRRRLSRPPDCKFNVRKSTFRISLEGHACPEVLREILVHNLRYVRVGPKDAI